MEVDADDTGVLLLLFLVNVAYVRHKEEKLLRMWAFSQRPSTAILPENTKTPILNLRRLLNAEGLKINHHNISPL